MTPHLDPQGHRAQGSGRTAAIVTGVVIAVVLLGLELGGTMLYAKHRGRLARKGWNLSPALVATRALKPGQKLTADMVTTGQIPEQFATRTLVKPEALPQVLGAQLVGELTTGDTLRWTDVLTEPVTVLVVTRDVKAGTALTKDELTTREVAKDFPGTSWARAGDETIAGKTLKVSLRAGDPVLTTFLE